MLHYYAATLRHNGGCFADAQIVVSVGEDCDPYDIDAAHPELRNYNITWRWVDREAFRQHSYFATAYDRWSAEFDADYVLMTDADTLVVADFSDAIAALPRPLGVAGVIATYPPFMASRQGNVDRERWSELFSLAGLGPVPFDYTHPGFGTFYTAAEGMEKSPPYFNFGFVIGTRAAMNAIRRTFKEDYLLAANYMGTPLSSQVALTLALERHRIPTAALPLRYNFWSWEGYVSAFPEEAQQVKILHYHNGQPFNKWADIDSHDKVCSWLKSRAGDDRLIVQFVHRIFAEAARHVEADLRLVAA